MSGDNKCGVSSLVLRDRKNLSVNGVCELVSYDDCEVILETNCGRLLVSGHSLHVSKLDLSAGEVEVDGEVDEAAYIERSGAAEKKGLLSRLFR